MSEPTKTTKSKWESATGNLRKRRANGVSDNAKCDTIVADYHRHLRGIIQHGAGIGSVVGSPWLATSIPFTSPRLMGELLYGVGKAGASAKNAILPSSIRPPLIGNMPILTESLLVNPAFREGLLATNP